VARTAAGHRLFGREEIVRLQQIRSLVHLGFSLAEVKSFLARPEVSPRAVLELHLARLDAALAEQRKLRRRLALVAKKLAAAEEVAADDYLQIIKETLMFEKYYTPEQLAELEARQEALGPAAIEQAQHDWAELIAAVQEQMDQGAVPTSPPVVALAQRWQKLVDAFTQSDPATTRSLAKMWQDEGEKLRQDHGRSVPSAEMMQYVGKARQAL
jgi:DNA-binding transcriptional MerR regulator